MSKGFGKKKIEDDTFWEAIYDNKSARDCLIPMGITSENVAEQFGVSKQEQDTMAMHSHAKAAHAQENGYFA